MVNNRHFDIIKQGVDVWNQWRNSNPKIVPQLQNVNLSKAELHLADLSYAYLNDAILTKAVLSYSNLSHANLSNADLSHAYLGNANLNHADLHSADFTFATLNGVNLSDANLKGAICLYATLTEANLSRAKCKGIHLVGTDLGEANLDETDLRMAAMLLTRFRNNDLSVANGLDTIKHLGPSIIDIGTIYKSGGKISEVFLRKVGVPDNFITYMRSLAGKAPDWACCAPVS